MSHLIKLLYKYVVNPSDLSFMLNHRGVWVTTNMRNQVEGANISKSTTLPKVSVIVVAYNSGKWIEQCIASIKSQSMADFECFVIDNDSTDGSFDNAHDIDDRFKIIHMDKNLGFAAANNFAAQKARAPWLALLNPDAFAEPDWLEHLLKATSKTNNVTMVGSTQYMATEPDKFDGLGDYYHLSGLAWRGGFLHPIAPVDWHEAFGPCAAAALYHRKTFLHIGGFDESFFCYHEDVDIAYRMRLIGGNAVQSPDAKVHHVSSGVCGRASEFAVYHGTRNRIWTFCKNTPWILMPILLPIHFAMCMFMLFWAGIRIGRFPSTLKGTIHGFAKGIPMIFAPRQTRNIPILRLLKAFSYSPWPVMRRKVAHIHTVDLSDTPIV